MISWNNTTSFTSPYKRQLGPATTKLEETEQKKFYESKIFKGGIKGYVFKTGSNGTGYYLDLKDNH